MTAKVSLSQTQRDSIGILYYCVKNALEVCETLQVDKNLDGIIRYNFIRIWAILLRKVKSQMDKNLACNVGFAEQIKDTDTQGLHNIITGYISLSPHVRSEVEDVFDKISKMEVEKEEAY